MRLDHEFTIPVPVGAAWPVLLDIEQVGPCLPGATITDVDGTEFDGKVKVKVGPITVTYTGHASLVEVDEEARRAVIKAKGKEARGSGTANATVTAQLHAEGDHTRVAVHTNLTITGRPAQFGRGVLTEVGAKLLGKFAANLADHLAAGQAGSDTSGTTETGSDTAGSDTAGADGAPAGPDGATAASEPAASQPAGAPTSPTAGTSSVRAAQATRPGSHEPDDALDLLEVAGASLVKRLAPLALAIVALLVLLRRRRR